MPEHIVTRAESETRLDLFLTSLMQESRSRIQKLIKSGDVTLNHKTVTPHIALRKGDIIFFPTSGTHQQQPTKNIIPLLEILYEDGDLLVINKPAGLVVHRAHELDTDVSVVDALLEHYPFIASVGDDPGRPGIVHRLDKSVSGVMVIAKTQEAFEELKKQFQERAIEKIYLALVYGQVSKDHDSIELKIARSKVKGRMVARTAAQEGKDAVTQYDVLKRFKTTTYLQVQILTGRTHQIRVHFRAIDHPLVGDKLYKKTRMKNIRPMELDRIFLHATSLTFRLMNHQKKTVTSPLPNELESLLKQQPAL